MHREWLLDVLTDLKTFALSNDLPMLAEQLEDTAFVALKEMSSGDQGGSDGRDDDKGANRNDAGKVGTGHYA